MPPGGLAVSPRGDRAVSRRRPPIIGLAASLHGQRPAPAGKGENLEATANQRLMIALGALLFVALGVGVGLLVPSDRPQERHDVVVGEINSADRLVFWTGCDDVAALSDADLDEWSNRGVDGFVCMIG